MFFNSHNLDAPSELEFLEILIIQKIFQRTVRCLFTLSSNSLILVSAVHMDKTCGAQRRQRTKDAMTFLNFANLYLNYWKFLIHNQSCN